MKYSRFFTMIFTSTAIMLGLMYLNTYKITHAFWSETRLYMAIIMGASMAMVMLSFMLGMYKNRKINMAIYIGSGTIFILALFLVRSQVTVQDSSYMRAMIPHHSIAIMTSERAQINDVRVRELADKIIRSQRQEIQEMKWLINDIKKNGKVVTQGEAEKRPLPTFEGKLNP